MAEFARFCMNSAITTFAPVQSIANFIFATDLYQANFGQIRFFVQWILVKSRLIVPYNNANIGV